MMLTDGEVAERKGVVAAEEGAAAVEEDAAAVEEQGVAEAGEPGAVVAVGCDWIG